MFRHLLSFFSFYSFCKETHVIHFLSPKNEIFFPPNTLTSVWTFVLVLRQKNPDMLNFDILAIYGCPDLSGIILPIFGPLEGFFYVSRSSNKYWTKKKKLQQTASFFSYTAENHKILATIHPLEC